jgi:hypothetical protein
VAGGPPLERQPRAVPVTHRVYDIAATRAAFPDFAPTPIRAGIELMWVAA